MATGKNIGALIVELLLNDQQFKQGLKGSEKDLQVSFSKMTKGLTAFQNSTAAIMKGAAAAVAGFAAATTVVGAKFEQQMAMAGAIQGINQTDKAFQELEGHARMLGSTTEFTATQAAEALTSLARAGAGVADQMEISKHALTLAGTSAAGLDESTQILIATQRQFGLETEQVEHATNVLSSVMRNSLFDFDSLREAMKYGGAAGAAFGYSLEETAAVMAKFKDLGLEGSMAGTQLRSALALAGAQTEKQAKVLAKYNLTLEDINPTTKSFEEILIAVGNAQMDATDTMKVFGRIAGGSMGILAQKAAEGSLGIGELTRKLEESSKAGNSAASMYDSIQNTVSYQSKIAISALQELFLTVYDLFRGPLQETIKEVPKLLNTISQSVKDNASPLRKTFSEIFGMITEFLQKNSKSLAQSFSDAALGVATFAKGLVYIGTVMAKVLNYSNELMHIIPTIFVASTILKVGAAFSTMSMSIAGATTALRTFVATLAASTGGVTALLAVVGTVVVALASYATGFLTAEDAASRLAKAETKLREERSQARSELIETTEHELRLAKARARVALEHGNLSEQEEKRLRNILELNAETLVSERQAGRMIQVGKETFTVQQLINERGAAGIAILKERAQQEQIQAKKAAKTANNLSDLISRYNEQLKVNTASANIWLKGNSKFYGMQVESIEEVQAKVNQLRQDEEAAFSRKDAINKALSDSAKKAESERKQAANQAKERRKQINVEEAEARKARLEALLSETAAMEQSATEEFKKATMSEAEFEADSFAERVLNAHALFEELAGMYEEGSNQRKEIEDRATQVIEKMMEARTKEMAKKAREAEEEEALKSKEQRVEIERDAQDLLKSLREEGLVESSKLQKEMNAELQALSLASADTRLAIEQEYQKRINAALEAEGSPIRYGSLWQKALSRIKVAFNKFGEGVKKVFRGIGKVVSGIGKAITFAVDKMSGLISTVTGGFKFDALGLTGELLDAKRAAEEEGLEFDAEATARSLVASSVQAGVEFVRTLATSLPTLIQEFAVQLPTLLQAVTDSLPLIFTAIAENLPGVIQSIIDSLPALFDALLRGLSSMLITLAGQLPDIIRQLLTQTLPAMIQTLAEIVPALIIELGAAIPDIIQAFAESIPTLISSVVRAVPLIIIALVKQIPVLITAIVRALPVIAMALVKSLFTELIPAIPAMVVAILKALVQALIDGLTAIGQAIGDIFRSKKGRERARERREKRASDNKAKQQEEMESMLADQFGDMETSAFSGMNFVPATMRMTLHKGEAVIPADRAAAMRGEGPAAAGLAQNNNMMGSGSGAPIEISVIAEGRLLEAVQIKAESRGHADKVQKAIRRASGSIVGFHRGKFNAWTS